MLEAIERIVIALLDEVKILIPEAELAAMLARRALAIVPVDVLSSALSAEGKRIADEAADLAEKAKFGE